MKKVAKRTAVARVDKLTPEQEARIPEWRDKWIRIGLSTEPADRPTFERAVRDCYRLSGLKEPKAIVWVSSPWALVNWGPALAVLSDQVDDQVRDQVSAQVRDQVDAQVRDQVRDQVSDRVDAQVRAQVGAQVRAQVGAQVHAQARETMARVRKAIANTWHYIIGGQFWVGWGYGWYGSPSFVSFFREVCGMELGNGKGEHADAYRDTAVSACWWWPHRDFVVVCDRPSLIARDEQGRLHSTTGPAIRFRDGWGVYAVHGTRIPREWVTTPGALTPQIALTHPNIEQRRAACEILGWGKILAQLKAKTIDKDKDPEIGTLLRVDLPDAPGEQFLRVRCGTGREFVIPVSRDARTARQANAETWSLEAEQYNPEVRT